MDLLIAQCSDLESLLALARREVTAAEDSNFRELVEVAKDRASLGQRLESYHRQIADLRSSMASMGRTAESLFENPVAQEIVRLAVEIQAVDSRSKTMLMTTQADTRHAINCLEQGRRNSVAYLHGDTRASGFNCDRQA